MAAGEQPRRAGDRIGTLLDALGAGGAVARERAEDLVREVTGLYGAGLERLLDILRNRGALDAGTMEALIADDLVSALLLIHNLHPQDLHARVAAALDSVRPYLGSHGGDVELLGINDGGVVRLRLLGTCQGCPSSSVTLKYAVEDAIEAAAPEVAAIEVVEAEKAAASPAVIPVEALRIRLGHGADGTESTGGAAGGPGELSGGSSGGSSGGLFDGSSGGSWEPLPEVADLEPGEVAGFLVGGSRILACRIGQDLYAYRDYCPRCTRSLEGAALQRALAARAGGGLLRCPSCRSHFDVRRAGACVEDGTMHLDPLPLLSRGGVMSVAVPQSAGHGG